MRRLTFIFMVIAYCCSMGMAFGLTTDQHASIDGDSEFYQECGLAGAATPAPAASSSNITVDNQAAQKAAQQASTGGTNVGYALYDSTGKLLASDNDTFENYGASITKSMILVAYLNQLGSGTMTSAEQTNVTGMIEDSSDPDANNVFGYLNNPSSEINAVAQQAGMQGFKYNDQGDKVYYLGQSQITANDFAKFFSKIDTMFPASQKSFALGLLSNIQQQVGLLQANLPGTVYSKEGWKPEPGTVDDSARSGSPNPFGAEGAPYIVNQAAQFTSGGTTYGLAVTVGGVSGQAAGETIVKDVASALITSGGQSTQSQGSSCCSDNSSITPPATNSGATGGATLDQVKTFASEPVTSTWNISNSTVEQWFLKQAGAQATIGKYGLNSSNIGQITSAVEAANISPVFFYLYTVNEGGGAGGFINHYGSDIPGGGPANAKHDAEYLASESKITSDGPAYGGGEPGDMPTAEAKQILDALPLGSLGVAYIQSTSAVTAELEDLSGKTGDWSGLFGTPLEDMMNNIKTMGGDPQQGGSTISTGGCTSGVTGQGIAKAISWAVMIAKNNGYGYSEAARTTGWTKYQSDPSCSTQCGFFDCSSFVAAALTEAGYFSTNPEFVTSTEGAALKGVGFTDVTSSVNLTTDAGMQPGDILVNSQDHTAIYIGNNQLVQAADPSEGIEVRSYYNYPWTNVYRAPN